MTQRLVAGVDSSTQSCKVVIRDAETGALVRSGSAKHPDGTEVHPSHWWAAFQEAAAAAGGLDDVEAIAVGGQQHGMVALDHNGEVIRDALLWNDTRSAGAARDLIADYGALTGRDGALAYAQDIGVVPVASFTATKVRWMRDHEPENMAKVAAIALPHDWLTWQIIGAGGEPGAARDLSALATDRSDASGTAYFNSTSGEYDRTLFELAAGEGAFDAITLPRVLAPQSRLVVPRGVRWLVLVPVTMQGPRSGWGPLPGTSCCLWVPRVWSLRCRPLRCVTRPETWQGLRLQPVISSRWCARLTHRASLM